MNMTDLLPWSRNRDVAVSPAQREPLQMLHRDINRLFDDLWSGFDGLPSRRMGLNWPAIAIQESEEQFLVSVELAGIEQKDVETFLDDDVLVIKGEKRNEHQNALLSEFFYGQFERRVKLPSTVQSDKVQARFKDGVLIVTLPKSAEAGKKLKRINIE